MRNASSPRQLQLCYEYSENETGILGHTEDSLSRIYAMDKARIMSAQAHSNSNKAAAPHPTM